MLQLLKEGHLISSCLEKWRVAQKRNSLEPKPNGFIAETQASPISEVSGLSKSVIDIFQSFIHDGSVLLSSDISDSIPIKITRDTGASQSLLSKQ